MTSLREIEEQAIYLARELVGCIHLNFSGKKTCRGCDFEGFCEEVARAKQMLEEDG